MKMEFFLMTLTAVILSLSQFNLVSAALISCEGFINSKIPLDLSKVQAKLFTAQGNLKHETECNPHNGYFFIPVYNKGKYLIKLAAPDGWIFVPEFHEIEIADEGSCSSDLNFDLYGFRINGNVLNGRESALKLGLHGENGNLIEETNTDANGQYSFIAKPGKYMISSISFPKQCVDHGNIKLEVKNSPVLVKPDIQISGHNLQIRVNDERGIPLPEVAVSLLSNKEMKFENLPIDAKKPMATTKTTQQQQQWSYSLTTDSAGIVLFNCLPIGKYQINMKLETPNKEVHFDEKTIEMESKSKEVVVGVKSFTIFGTAIVAESKPIENAKIMVDGIEMAVTDKKGIFKLTNISPGKHKISAEKENFEFAQIDIEASIKMDGQIRIKPKRMAICGNILPADQLDNVHFEIASSLNNAIVDKFQTKGKFCRMLEPGKYIIRPISSISFYPKQIGIDLTDGPAADDIKFIQYKAKVGGKVVCLGNKCKNIQIEIWQIGDTQSTEKLEVPMEGTFKFNDILPAKYKLKIIDRENIWWEMDAMDIEILDKDVLDLRFIQKGYRIEIMSSHSAIFEYWPESEGKTEKNKQQFPLVEGKNFIKFMETSKFAFSINSCHEFSVDGAKEGNVLSVPAPSPITLTAISSSISIILEMDGDDPSLQLKLRDKISGEELNVQQVIPSARGRKTYIFRLGLSKMGNEFQIITKSDKLLFMPESSSFTFDGKCNNEMMTLKSQIGKFIQGRVEPNVPGTNVKAIHRKTPEIVFNTQIDASGKYKIGPVWNVDDFTVQLAKEGFEFHAKTNNPHNFESVKLSQLIIQFLDSTTKLPLSDVLISISGGTNNIRSKNFTDNSGILNFIGLASGTYFIRPILQEYKFNSSSFTVHIDEGLTQELILEANRFAYSLFGKVSTISSKPLRIPIRIEAVSGQCENHQEEALLDQKTDEFRIRGLKPECVYKVQLKDANKDKEIKAFPPFINIITGKEDKIGANFVLLPMEMPDPVAVGELDIETNAIPIGGFRVLLSEAGNILQEQIVHSPSTIFFINLPAYNREYTISIANLEGKQKKIEPISVNFVADLPFNYVKLTPKSEYRTSDIEVLRANYLGLALIFLITLAFMNQSKTKLLAEYILEMARDFIRRRQENTGKTTSEDLIKRKKAKKM